MATFRRWVPQIALMVAVFLILMISNPREDLPTVGAIYAFFSSRSRHTIF